MQKRFRSIHLEIEILADRCLPSLFGTPLPFTLGSGLSSRNVAIGDFNNDHKLDLAVTTRPLVFSPSGGMVSILLGDGQGRFMPTGLSPLFTGTDDVAGIAAGDFNHDGNVDLVTANGNVVTPQNNDKGLSVFLGDGTGAFYRTAISPFSSGDREPFAVAVGDFNNDGDLDLVTANTNGNQGILINGQGNRNTVSILLGDGNGAFSLAIGSPTPSGDLPFSLALADFNHDDNLDFAVANYGSGSVGIYLGDGNGGLNFSRDHTVAPPPSNFSVAVGDFNNDGNPDFVTFAITQSTVSLFLGDGTGAFVPSHNSPFPIDIINPITIATGDFNGDGKLDIVTVSTTSIVSIFLGDGLGNFAPAADSPIVTGSYAYDVAVGDFNADGRLDLVVTQLNTIVILLNQTGVFPANNPAPPPQPDFALFQALLYALDQSSPQASVKDTRLSTDNTQYIAAPPAILGTPVDTLESSPAGAKGGGDQTEEAVTDIPTDKQEIDPANMGPSDFPFLPFPFATFASQGKQDPVKTLTTFSVELRQWELGAFFTEENGEVHQSVVVAHQTITDDLPPGWVGQLIRSAALFTGSCALAVVTSSFGLQNGSIARERCKLWRKIQAYPQ